MAILKLDPELVVRALFENAMRPVAIHKMLYNMLDGKIEVEVSGADVPDAENVALEMTTQRNNAGAQFVTVSFRAV